MIKLGAHFGISKGFANVPEVMNEIGANAFQIFVHSPRTWKIKQLNVIDVENFKNKIKKMKIDKESMLVHSGYLINLASPKDEGWKKSIDTMIEEIKITASLGIKYFNVHPGSHLSEGEDFGIDRVANALDIIIEQIKDFDIMILLENVAKKGGNIGYKINQLGDIIKRTNYKEKIGITYDTCHGFDSNYDIRTKDGMDNLLFEINEYVGIDKLKMIHLNDSKFDLGAGKDRHEIIGKGFIGEEGFKNFFKYEKVLNTALLLETPGTDEDHRKEIAYIKKAIAQ
ncbi:putative endonuclease 4 [Tepiditoga spiralis]|uniref:Probable endonuclease 4 n=1 Tax=Tepiditoga spiralis TaxID=2108365 RepID=A0A7G1G6L4_9BACT|nr:deoxyribonuclease IV [Tepiditoga spiralis]BBE32091.1 putative endonuclease 4 [Tepiditoga spiralis]